MKNTGIASFFDLRDAQTPVARLQDDTIPIEFGRDLRTAVRNGEYRQHIEAGGSLDSYFTQWLLDHPQDDTKQEAGDE